MPDNHPLHQFSASSQRLEAHRAQSCLAACDFLHTGCRGKAVLQARMPWWKTLWLGVIAGIYLSFGGALAYAVGGRLPETYAENPGFQALVFGAFGLPFGLALIVICGAELWTSNVAYMPAAFYEGRANIVQASSTLATLDLIMPSSNKAWKPLTLMCVGCQELVLQLLWQPGRLSPGRLVRAIATLKQYGFACAAALQGCESMQCGAACLQLHGLPASSCYPLVPKCRQRVSCSAACTMQHMHGSLTAKLLNTSMRPDT